MERAVVAETSSDAAIARALSEGQDHTAFPDSDEGEFETEAGAVSRSYRRSNSMETSEGGTDIDSMDVDRNELLDATVSQRVATAPSVKMVQPSVIQKMPSRETLENTRQTLVDRVKLYGLQEHEVKGDGNCQFRSISDQLYRSPKYHHQVRSAIVSQLKGCKDEYECYVPEDFENYCKDMSRKGTWGDHVTLQAASDYYGVKMFVLSSYNDSCLIEINPKEKKSQRMLYLSFWAEVHYNSLYPEGLSLEKLRDKTILGSRQLHKLLRMAHLV